MANVDRRKVSIAHASMETSSSRLGRKRSSFRGVAKSVTEILTLHKNIRSEAPVQVLENTYKMQPTENEKFSASTVEKLVKNVLEEMLENCKYDSATCAATAQVVSDRLRLETKALKFSRYKIVCNVLIGQNTQQDIQLASRSIWDSKTDSYACVTYKNSSLYAVALVYGVYFE